MVIVVAADARGGAGGLVAVPTVAVAVALGLWGYGAVGWGWGWGDGEGSVMIGWCGGIGGDGERKMLPAPPLHSIVFDRLHGLVEGMAPKLPKAERSASATTPRRRRKRGNERRISQARTCVVAGTFVRAKNAQTNPEVRGLCFRSPTLGPPGDVRHIWTPYLPLSPPRWIDRSGGPWMMISHRTTSITRTYMQGTRGVSYDQDHHNGQVTPGERSSSSHASRGDERAIINGLTT